MCVLVCVWMWGKRREEGGLDRTVKSACGCGCGGKRREEEGLDRTVKYVWLDLTTIHK